MPNRNFFLIVNCRREPRLPRQVRTISLCSRVHTSSPALVCVQICLSPARPDTTNPSRGSLPALSPHGSSQQDHTSCPQPCNVLSTHTEPCKPPSSHPAQRPAQVRLATGRAGIMDQSRKERLGWPLVNLNSGARKMHSGAGRGRFASLIDQPAGTDARSVASTAARCACAGCVQEHMRACACAHTSGHTRAPPQHAFPQA